MPKEECPNIFPSGRGVPDKHNDSAIVYYTFLRCKTIEALCVPTYLREKNAFTAN